MSHLCEHHPSSRTSKGGGTYLRVPTITAPWHSFFFLRCIHRYFIKYVFILLLTISKLCMSIVSIWVYIIIHICVSNLAEWNLSRMTTREGGRSRLMVAGHGKITPLKEILSLKLCDFAFYSETIPFFIYRFHCNENLPIVLVIWQMLYLK